MSPMLQLLILIFTLASVASFWIFLKRKFSPLWLMFSVWFIAIAISQLHLSSLELAWPAKYWLLVFVSLVSFALGVVITQNLVLARRLKADEAISKKEIASLIARKDIAT